MAFAYYPIALLIWARLLWELRDFTLGPQVFTSHLGSVAPSLLLLATCGWAYRHREKRRLRNVLAIIALSVMVMGSAYDYSRSRYQVGAHDAEGGARHFYFNWPWLTTLPPR